MHFGFFHRSLSFAACMALIVADPVRGESVPPPSPLPAMSWADLADLADSAPLVVRAQLRKLTQVEPERARGVRPGHGRFYIEARTEALIAGTGALGEDLRFLADLPLDPKGKPPKLKKTSAVLFARGVPGRPGELQLVQPDAMTGWDPATDSRLRSILSELLGGSAPPRVTGVREAIFVPGNLQGEGETQLFLATRGGEPAAITVIHSPGERPHWSVSFSEAIDTSGRPPQRETLAWYRLACFLPSTLPATAHVSATPADREQAAEDYGLVRAQLGPCQRNRR